MTKYILYLSYPDVCKVIDFAESYGLYSHITYGGVVVQDLTKDLLIKLTKFLESLKVRFEISDVAPFEREVKVVNKLKRLNII